MFSGRINSIYGIGQGAKYKNPLNVYKIADPFILFYKGKYYLYATSEKGATTGGGFEVWTSNNLIDWKYEGWVYKSDENSWGKDSFWAPEVIYKDGRFYLFYSAGGYINNRKTLRICLAVSDSPLGPFKDLRAPLFDFGYATIDAHPFVDDDGNVSLYFSRDVSENPTSDIYVVRLSNDLLETVSESKFLLKPSQSWEISSRWNEGPFVVKHNKKYYLFYSANFFASPEYSVGYAVSNSPIGPFEKAKENPILKKTDYISGPGHNSVIKTQDGKEYFIVYHTQMGKKGTHLRQLAIDRLIFTNDGKIKVLGPTHMPQPYPSGVLKPKPASSDDFSNKFLDLQKWTITGESTYSLAKRPGYLRIETMVSDILNFLILPFSLTNIYTQYVYDENFEVSTQFDIISEEIGDRVGLIVFENYNNYLEFVRVSTGGKPILEFIVKNNEKIEKIAVKDIPNSSLCYLKLQKNGKTWNAFYKFSEKENWKKFNKAIENQFDVLKVGITAYSTYSIGGSIYDFNYFPYRKIE